MEFYGLFSAHLQGNTKFVQLLAQIIGVELGKQMEKSGSVTLGRCRRGCQKRMTFFLFL
jgi:hypothetical protein